MQFHQQLLSVSKRGDKLSFPAALSSFKFDNVFLIMSALMSMSTSLASHNRKLLLVLVA